jgi:hypothetical protein
MAEQVSGWKIDKTINLPFILSLVAALVYVTLAMARSENKADRAIEKADRAEAGQVVMRSEIRNDMRDMSNKLDTVIMRLGTAPANLKEWTK